MRILKATLFLLCVFVAPHTLGADFEAGKIKASQACQTCHGVDGVSQLAMVPNLSGQRADYTKIQLEAYRSGKRQHAQMSIIAQSLTDEEIVNLAEWYSKINVTVSLPGE
ncbi:MAG: cytochrome c [Acidiferrobacterales bacterium]|nr:cytochrome c [Acidiferrobacterales bacterium]